MKKRLTGFYMMHPTSLQHSQGLLRGNLPKIHNHVFAATKFIPPLALSKSLWNYSGTRTFLGSSNFFESDISPLDHISTYRAISAASACFQKIDNPIENCPSTAVVAILYSTWRDHTNLVEKIRFFSLGVPLVRKARAIPVAARKVPLRVCGQCLRPMCMINERNVMMNVDRRTMQDMCPHRSGTGSSR